MDNIFNNAEWFAYLCALIGPFIQEDVAVLGAASAAVSGVGTPLWMFVAVTIGLTVSDLWKYWLGRAAISQPWAKKHAQGTRIPLYIAAGFFKASFVKFSIFIFLSALIYIAIAFGLFHLLGEVAGEEAKKYLPIVAIVGFGLFLLFKRLKGPAK